MKLYKDFFSFRGKRLVPAAEAILDKIYNAEKTSDPDARKQKLVGLKKGFRKKLTRMARPHLLLGIGICTGLVAGVGALAYFCVMSMPTAVLFAGIAAVVASDVGLKRISLYKNVVDTADALDRSIDKKAGIAPAVPSLGGLSKVKRFFLRQKFKEAHNENELLDDLKDEIRFRRFMRESNKITP